MTVDKQEQHKKGVKLDQGKIDMSLLQELPLALGAVCHVMDYGQTKYTRGGFLTVSEAVKRYTSGMFRHLFKEPFEKFDSDDPFYDTEEGSRFKGTVRHDAQAATNALFRLEVQLRIENGLALNETHLSYMEDEDLWK